MCPDSLGLNSANLPGPGGLELKPISMRRLAILTILLTALSVVGSVGFIRAFSDAGHPFSTTWCDSPVVIQLADEGLDGVVTTAAGVSVARGAEASVGTRGPGVRLNELGSRVQVDLGQTLFHTQWLFSSVSAGDAVRTDALIGSAPQPVNASSVRGALVPAADQLDVGLLAEAIERPSSTGQIDVFSGATEFLFTNEGATPIELIAAIGCPAIEMETEQLSPPTWDPSEQRFVSEHRVILHNQLANNRVRAIRELDRDVASTIVEDVSVNLDLAAAGFSSAEIVEVIGFGPLSSRLNEQFDGIFDTTLLSNPLRLADSNDRVFTFSVGYEPDFSDPAWNDGIAAPAPQITVQGRVDSVQVGLSGFLHASGADVDRSVSPDLLESPTPGVALQLNELAEPNLGSDGRVELAHEFAITNTGETAVTALNVTVPLVEMFGPGTVIESVDGLGNGVCQGPISSLFDGDAAPVLLSVPEGLQVGQSCTVSFQTRLIPGIQAGFDGTTYDAPVSVTAQSGVRTVRAASSLRASLTQEASLDIAVGEVQVVNNEDGRYQVDGTITLRNDGALTLAGATISLDVQRPAAPVDATEDDATGDVDGAARAVGGPTTLEAAPVFFFAPIGDDRCVTGGAPNGASASAFVSGGIALSPGESCEVEFSFISIPGSSIDDWQINARTATVLTAIQPEINESATSNMTFPEAPAIETTVEVEPITTSGNGTYVVRTVATVRNSGDTPLTSVTVVDDTVNAFGAQLISHEIVGDSCSGVSGQSPLPTGTISPEGNACSVVMLSVIEPGADLDGDVVEYQATATSTSTVEVDDSVETEVISFTETARLETSIAVESVERIDANTVAFVVAGSIVNTGNVDARGLQAQLNLGETFDLDDGDVPFEMLFLNVDGVTASEDFDGARFINLFAGTETVVVDGRIDYRLLIHATPSDQPGPYQFTVEPSATSPARNDVSTRPANSSISVPIIGIVARSLESENNNDGTYDVTHSVTVENAGIEELESIAVFTGFDQTFGNIVVGEVQVASTCDRSVSAGAECEVTQTAAVRPGSTVGPYEVDVSIGAVDAAAVDALIIPEAPSSQGNAAALLPLRFEENPEIELDSVVGEAENNSDGTYTVTYDAEVTNSGDVPLYRVGIADFVTPTFGDAVVSNEIQTDSCALVSFVNPLSPDATCERSHTVTLRPLANLGPWTPVLNVSADSPSLARLEDDLRFESITFTEEVELSVDASLSNGANNGDGTYTPAYEVVVTNTGNVPIIELSAPDAGAGYGAALVDTSLLADSCTIVSFGEPLLPGSSCTIEQTHLISPGQDLGEFELDAEISGSSASGEVVEVEDTTNTITLSENPVLELESEVTSVENLEDGAFRAVMNLRIVNAGDVRIDDLAVELDLDEVFPDIPFRVDGVVSNDFLIEEAFTAGESDNVLAPGQSMLIDAEGVVTLVLTVEPGSDVGPFTGELRVEGNSPARAGVTSVITAQLDLPSVAVSVIAQSIDNNRDGSYTVTSSYEVVNNGTTALEFVQLNEDLGAIYEGTIVRLVSIDGDGLPIADVEDDQRSNNLIEWAAGLESGESATMTSTVVVTPGNILGPFIPFVSAQAASPTGTFVRADATSRDTIEFVERPALRVEQNLQGRPVWNGDRFEVTFAIDVINDGDVELRGVQVREDLLNALGLGSRILVRDIRSETLAVNGNFDGLGKPPTDDGAEPASSDIGDTRLLSGGDTLAAGATETVELDLVITPETRGVYRPRVVVSARTPAGADLGGGDEQIEANTLTRLSVQGELGVAKQVIGDAVIQGNGSISVTYEILVENAGPFPLDNVAVHDQLSQAFGVGSSFETSPVRIEPGSPCAGYASTSYDGGTVDPVLATGFELQSGERCRIQYDAVVTPSIALPGPYRSSAFAIATDPFSGTVIDDSTDGTNTDPDGNQEPGDNDIATPVQVVIPEPSVQVAIESLPSSALDATGRFELGYRILVTNDGGIDVQASRFVADLDELWDVDYDVLSLESSDVDVNDSFNGGGETNLLDRRSVLAAGETAELVLRVRAVEPDDGALELDIEVQGVSVTGDPITSRSGEPTTAEGPNGVETLTLFDTLTTQEKQLLALGSGAILLFLALFIRSAFAKVRSYREKRALHVAASQELPEPASEPANDYLYLDLRPRETPPQRKGTPTIDLTEPAAEELEERKEVDEVEEVDEDEVVDTRGVHHKSRRRRGRRPQRRVDS